MASRIGRRRFIAVTAVAAAGLPLRALVAGEVPLTVWNGTALGARASIRLYHPDTAAAERLIAHAQREIERLEAIFSLYRLDSTVSRLNRDATLAAPPFDLVALLSRARGFSELTDGVFDATVQPLWRLYAAHFADQGRRDGPDAAAIARVRALVDYRGVRVSPQRAAFHRPGMAITLNGIAQGYVTDRVAALFHDAGLPRVLLDLGEARALGGPADAGSWSVGVADPARPGRLAARLALTEGAVATSAPSGFRFDAAGRYHHLFDPRTGLPAARHASVTVLAPDATTADALSTAFVQMRREEVTAVLARRPEIGIVIIGRSGAISRFGAAA